MTEVLDGATLRPDAVARIARHGARVELAEEARARNQAAARAAAAVLERGHDLYGVTTGVGPLRAHRLDEDERAEYQLRLLRSHACGAGWPLRMERVRAAMATRANQLGAGGTGISDELLDALVAALNAGFIPFTRELGSLGTGDLTTLTAMRCSPRMFQTPAATPIRRAHRPAGSICLLRSCMRWVTPLASMTPTCNRIAIA